MLRRVLATVFVVLPLILTCGCPAPTPRAIPTASPVLSLVPTTAAMPAPMPTATPLTPAAQWQAVIQDALAAGVGPFGSLNNEVIPGRLIALTWYIPRNVNGASETVATVAKDFVILAPKALAIPGVDGVMLSAGADIADMYGKSKVEAVFMLRMSRKTADKIVWSRFDSRNLKRVLTESDDAFWVHSTLEAAWRVYEVVP